MEKRMRRHLCLLEVDDPVVYSYEVLNISIAARDWSVQVQLRTMLNVTTVTLFYYATVN